MSRLDWKRGRFDRDFETNQMQHGLRGYQNSQRGSLFDYWRFDFERSEVGDIYDEGWGEGRFFRPPVALHAMEIAHDEGRAEQGPDGFYFVDGLYVKCSYEQIHRAGLNDIDVSTQNYLNDRMVYDGKVFRVSTMHVLGQIEDRDVILSIEGEHMKPDEIANDPQFAAFKE